VRYFTIGNYLLVSVLWGAILALYIRHTRLARRDDALVATLTSVLALDAFKSAVENLYFGILWTGEYGLGFQGIARVLSQPAMLVIPKLLNTLVALVVLTVVLRRWIPRELQDRRRRERERTALLGRLEASRAEGAAKEERWQLVLEGNADGIFDLDVGTGVAWLSPRFAETLGYTPAELGNLTLEAWLASVHPDDRARAAETFASVIAGEATPHELEVRERTKDDRYRTFVIRAAIVRGPDGRATRIVGSHTDVTDRRQAEAALAARERTESLGLLAGGIAHDVNNYLAVIRANVGVLQHRKAADPEILADIDSTVMRASELTARLLAYSGKGKFVVGPIDLSVLARDIVRLMRSSAGPEVEVDIEVSPALPLIVGDAAQIQQVVMNLFKNALDAVGAAGKVTVRTRLEHVTEPIRAIVNGEADAPPGDYVVLEIEDTGSGMSAETVARIFTPFFSTKSSGRGLGMSAVLGILRGHGAAMRIESALGTGTTFTVFFPSSGRADQGETAPRPAPGAPATAHEKRALVVDDEAMVRRATARVVGRLGFEVTTEGTGRGALARLAEQPFDLVLLDLTMPDLDGHAVLAEIRRLYPQTPVILMSGYTAEAAPMGPGVAFLQKPFAFEELERCLRGLAS
jgi:PAS domain S-box-containing protein